MTDLDLLLESFRRNGRVNEALLNALVPADFDLSDGRGGWTIGRHLRHMAGFRVGWLHNLSREHAAPLLDPTQQDADGDPQWRWHDSPPTELAAAFAAGDEAAVTAVQAHLASGEPFADPWNEGGYRSHPAHFLQHTIVHDSHHRGQIMALLRLGGRTKEQMDALDEHWAIWRE
ncbi:DinB family protein [Deinococcus sp. NW-56]|uniref:DinB family protein n=1 Tax=Deinococcus sp. NW-56 TaxID=2080419 RepID=UPI000CF44152|nr:DinB family protein [Deinococcus sp. NW-56]